MYCTYSVRGSTHAHTCTCVQYTYMYVFTSACNESVPVLQAYHLWMVGNVRFEQQKWKEALECFGQSQLVSALLVGGVPLHTHTHTHTHMHAHIHTHTHTQTLMHTHTHTHTTELSTSGWAGQWRRTSEPSTPSVWKKSPLTFATVPTTLATCQPTLRSS